jgi:hypothetical protein
MQQAAFASIKSTSGFKGGAPLSSATLNQLFISPRLRQSLAAQMARLPY